MLITAAGNLTHEGIGGRWCVSISKTLPASRAVHRRESAASHARPIALQNKKSLEQVHLCLGVPSYPLPHEERFACLRAQHRCWAAA